MKIKHYLTKYALPLSILQTENWPDLNPELLSPSERERYTRYKHAITRVVRDRATFSAAAREQGLDRSELDRLTERCFQPAADGQIEGYRALGFYRRLRPYQKRLLTEPGTAGLMSSLLERFPDIDEALWQEYRQGESIAALVEWLCEELLPKAKWPRHLYPYNTVTKGREGLRLYLERRKKRQLADEWGEQGESDDNRKVIRPFQRVELDAHRCDAHFTLHLPGPEGLSRSLVLERIWLLVLIEAASRAALGYAFCFNRQCSIPDVLEAIHCAIVPQPRIELTIPGLDYRPGAGFPNQLIPACAWQLFDLICLDNAMAHRSEKLHQILSERIHCNIRLNRSRTPNDNPLVERFFNTLTAHGFKRTPSTTGSGPDDPRRQDSEAAAERYEFHVNDAEQVVDVLLANYNADMHRGICTTPLGYLQTYYREVPAITRVVPALERPTWTLRQMWEEATIRGSINKGKRPYVEYLDEHYRNEFLSVSSELIDQPVLLLISFEDLRSLKAYFPDGRFLGQLRACGRWALTKHSLKTRRLCIHLARTGELVIGYRDPIRALRAYLEDKAGQSKWARNQLAQLLREAEEPSKPAETNAPEPIAESYQPNRNDWISFRTPVYD